MLKSTEAGQVINHGQVAQKHAMVAIDIDTAIAGTLNPKMVDVHALEAQK